MRIILDTNTVISGLFWRGKPFQVLELMRLGRIKVYTSGAILEELLDVLNCPKFSTRLALLGFSPQEVVNKVWRCYNIRLGGACARLTHPREFLI